MKALKKMTRTTLAAAAIAFAAMLIVPSTAFAEPQAAVPMQPPSAVPDGAPGDTQPALPPGAAPQPRLTLSPRSALIGFGVMAVLLCIVVAVSFIPSKRGHQD